MVLEFEGVSVERGPGVEVPLVDLSFRLAAGELALFEVQSGLPRVPIADMACGMVTPQTGRVRLDGREWSRRGPRETQEERARLGRVFQGSEWVSNLNVDENVLLASCHHTRRPEAEILEEAIEIVSRFGLDDLSRKRPNLLAEPDLRVHAIARAFVGRPRVLLLERPLRGIAQRHAAVFVELLRARLDEGACALLVSADGDALAKEGLVPDHRFRITPPQVERLQGTVA